MCEGFCSTQRATDLSLGGYLQVIASTTRDKTLITLATFSLATFVAFPLTSILTNVLQTHTDGSVSTAETFTTTPTPEMEHNFRLTPSAHLLLCRQGG